MKELLEKVAQLAAHQGWSHEAVDLMAWKFIAEDENLLRLFVAHLEGVAEVENEMVEGYEE